MKTRIPILVGLVVLGLVFTSGWVSAAPSRQAGVGPLDVVINEVAWMGTAAGFNDEWIELHNNTNANVDLTAWTLRADDGTPNITLSGTILAHGYFLLERTGDGTISDTPADQIYTGALENGNEPLTLRNAAGDVIDTVNNDGGDWPAGNNTTKQTMERICPSMPDSDDNWATNDGITVNGLDANGDPLNGTPKTRNSATPAPPDGLDTAVVGNFTIVFLDVAYNADGTSTWTYSASSDCATGGNSPALSHWILDLCAPAIDGVTPSDGDMYTTIGIFDGASGRPGITYDVKVGPDGSGTGVTGIKFEDGVPNLGEAGFETDVFQFTLDEHYDTTPVRVGAKAGQQIATGYILGPACEPTAITLVSFTAEAGADGVTLAWETATEIDNAGFNLYRALLQDGPYTRVNDALIAAQGDPVSGASYSFVDAPGYGTFYYKLEDVDLYGTSTLHEPVKVTVARPLRRPLYRPTLPGF